MTKKHGDHIESFGVKYRVGDIVGSFLDADRNCISKNIERIVSLCFLYSSIVL